MYDMSLQRRKTSSGHIEEHILKMHVALENVPYYCCLCLFKGQRKEQLLQHFKTCKRHRDMAEKRGIEQGVNETLIVQSSTPYRLSAVDYVQLSAEESLAHFMDQAKSRAVAESRSQLATTLNQMFPGLIEDGGMQCTTPDCMTESVSCSCTTITACCISTDSRTYHSHQPESSADSDCGIFCASSHTRVGSATTSNSSRTASGK